MFFRSPFNNKKRSPEDWHRRLIRTKNPRELAITLLSDEQAFEEKVKIVLAMPKSAKEKLVDMRWLESELEKHGHHQLSQIVRWQQYWNLDDIVSLEDSRVWSQKVVEADIEGRWIIQRETHVREEVRALQKSLELNDAECAGIRKHQLSAYEEEFQKLDSSYRAYQKRAWNLEGNVPLGVVTRAFRACRENPDWYLCAWLRQDCAGRGGCCGRECGCCEIAGAHSGYGQPRGHCTSACGCCARTRRLEIRNYGGKDDMEDFPFDIVACNSAYSKRIFRAYIWRLTFLDEMGLCGTYW